MKIRGKMFMILGISYLFISIGIIVSSNNILISGFIEQENEDIIKQLEIGAHSLELRMETLEHTAIEHGHNDNIYMFMQSGMQHLVNDFLLSSNFIEKQFSFLAFRDLEGTTVLSKSFDHIELRNTEIDESVMDLLNSETLFDLETTVKGVLPTESGLLMISSSPILTTEGKGPAMGVTIVGRYLDQIEVNRLAETTSVDLKIMKNTEMVADGNLSNGNYYVNRPKYDSITAYKALTDLEGSDSIAIQVESDRDYFNQAVMMLAYFVGSSVLTGLIIGFIAMIATNRFILEKIIKLSGEVNAINPRSLEIRKVEIQGDDEISELSMDIDNMIDVLGEYQQILKEKERMATIGETAAMVGHDLRNPLQVVVMLSSRLSKISKKLVTNGVEDRSIKELDLIEEKLRDQTGYMNKIVSDLQDYSRNIKLNLADSDLIGMIMGVLEMMNLPNSINVETEMDDSLSNVYADETYLRRVFNNLINNAVQAMPKGGNLKVIGVTKGESALFTVSDTGSGIKLENRDSIFTPLFTTKAKGTGLGLAVCKRVVTAHGGRIWFESEVGVGTKFNVEIPMTRAEEVSDIPTSTQINEKSLELD